MNSYIILTVKNMTFAQKAKKILARGGIDISVRRLDDAQTASGCGFGIVIPYTKHYEAIELLRESGIPYSLYEEKKR